MEKVRIKSYAITHKLSIFNVMKMVKSGKLKSEIIEENGKEITYILLDEITELEVKKGIVSVEKKGVERLKIEMKLLNDEVKLLRAEIEILKNKIK
jgi:citrate lyase gamma subunit